MSQKLDVGPEHEKVGKQGCWDAHLASSQRKDGGGTFSFNMVSGLTEEFGSQPGSSSPTPMQCIPPPNANCQKAFNLSDSTVKNLAQGNN